MNSDQQSTETDAAPSPATALMFTGDLFFGSKVSGTAAMLGFRVELEADITRGITKLSAGEFRCVILDLAMPGLDVAAVIGKLNDLPAPNRPRAIAFGSHVETERLESARQAGCHEVMPRSRFSAELPQILTAFCSIESAPADENE